MNAPQPPAVPRPADGRDSPSPPDGQDAPAFLDAGFVARAVADAFLPLEVQSQAVAVARRAGADAALRDLARHAHDLVYGPAPYAREAVWRLPLPVVPLGEDSGLLYLLVLLAGVPALRERYERLAIPEAVARDTLFDVERWLRRYRAAHGEWGLQPRALTWLRNHTQGRLFTLGRLQHQLNEFHGGVYVFRHRATSAVVALSEDGARYRADGQFDGAGGVADPHGAWTATLQRGPDGVTGSPVSPAGYVLREPLHLPAAEWDEVLAPGDPVLQLHIPDGSPMDFDACGESLRQALTFFPRHFPAHRFRAFACSSWLLDAQLQGLLPPHANLVRFQREVFLQPAPGDGSAMLSAVFGAPLPLDDSLPEALARAPQRTTLQRALAAHLAHGGRPRGGRCFLLRDDLAWGSRVYGSRAGGTTGAGRSGPAAPYR